MDNRNDYDLPREEAAPSDSPQEDWVNGYFIDEDENETPHEPQSRSIAEWFGALSPRSQTGYGCLAILILSALLVYCVGGATVFVRPMIAERAVISPTPVVRPTLAPTPTQDIKPTFIQLPPGKLVETPTQAPMPTRQPATFTPTTEMVNGMTVTPSPSATRSVSPTRKPTTAPTTRP